MTESNWPHRPRWLVPFTIGYLVAVSIAEATLHDVARDSGYGWCLRLAIWSCFLIPPLATPARWLKRWQYWALFALMVAIGFCYVFEN